MRARPSRAGLALRVGGWLACYAGVTAASPSPGPTLRATRVADGAVEVDGRQDEPVWAAAPRAQGFVQREPYQGQTPSEATWASVVYDSDALYVFIQAWDRQPSSITGQVTRRDEWNPDLDGGRAFGQHSDFVELWLDPQNDGLTGYTFSVSAAGVQVDARYSAGGETRDPVWNGVWDSAVLLHENGWSAELRIPFSQVRYDADASSWGIQFVRYLRRENEVQVFSPTPRAALRPLQHLARLTGLEALPSSTSLEALPYVAALLQNDAGRREFRLRAGGEARIGLGTASTLQLTVLPDFGQVEQDPSQLNLTAYEVFLTERRPFFVEGQEMLMLPLLYPEDGDETLYYSRRIGAPPTRDLDLEEPELLRYPRETTVLGAAKIVGRTDAGSSYSALQVLTGRERASVRVDGEHSQPVVSSPASYSVLRLRQELGRSGSSVGLLGTNVYRWLDRPMVPHATEQATTAAADFDLRADDYGITGHLIGSRIAGSAEAVDAVQRSSTHFLQRPDARHVQYDPTRTSLEGFGFGVRGGKLAGAPWRISAGVQARNPYLELNDIGYLRYADQQSVFGNVTWLENEPDGIYRDYNVTSSLWLDRSFGGELTGRGVSLTTGMGFANNWYAWLGGLRRTEALDVGLLRGGPAFRKPGGYGAWWGIGSDPRAIVHVELDGNADYNDEESTRFLALRAYFGARPYSALTFSVRPEYQRSLNDLQYVDTLTQPTPAIILGRLSQETFSLTLRLQWALSRTFTFEAYAMPFLSAGDYQVFYEVVAPRAADYEDRKRPTAYAGDDRFLVAEVRSNLVLRWDYWPGSSMYLAWAHEQLHDGDHRTLDLTRDVPAMLGARTTDTLFFKWAHYLDL